jgi:DNA polymerase
MTQPDLSLAREFEAALAWWRAAGVDCDYHDDATSWLADAPSARAPLSGDKPAPMRPTASGKSPAAGQPARLRADAPAPAPAQTPRPDLLGESPPTDLAAFREWWMHAPGLDTARLHPRIAPRGPAGAALMVLVPQPEEGDRERLLDGPQGRLLGNILAAAGLGENAVYCAAALPCHTPMADIAALAASGMDAVTAHHVSLAAPQRVLVLGSALGPMLGETTQEGLRRINNNGRTIPAMVSETLEAMMDMPRLKSRFWRRWMEWTASH